MEAQLIHTLEKGNMRMDQQKKEQRNESRRQEMKEVRGIGEAGLGMRRSVRMHARWGGFVKVWNGRIS